MKTKLIQSFIILSTSTAITKIFSIINRMVLARSLSTDAMALFILVIPTLSLCITLGQLGIPSAVFRLISNPKYKNHKIILSAVCISFFSCITIMTLLFFSTNYIALELFKTKEAIQPLYILCLFIPFVAISGILKNYYLAKENVYIIAKAQLIEEIARLLFIIIVIKYKSFYQDTTIVSFAYLSMVVGEFVAIIYMMIRLNDKPKYFFNLLPCFKQNLQIKDLLNIALPITGTRLYHSFVSFLEPIILIAVLSSTLSTTQIHQDYAIMSGFVISILVTPTFFNTVIYRLLLPIITKDIYQKDKKATHRHLMYGLLSCFLISLPFTILFYFFSKECLQFIYNTTDGWQQLKYLSIPFTLFYLQTPLSVILHALNKNKIIFIISVIECTLEIILTYILASYYGVFAIAISLLIGVLITLTLSSFYVYKYIYSNPL